MSVVNRRIYRFWIWTPVPRGNLGASRRNLALITAIYSSPPSMTPLRIRMIEAPIRELTRLVRRRREASVEILHGDSRKWLFSEEAASTRLLLVSGLRVLN